ETNTETFIVIAIERCLRHKLWFHCTYQSKIVKNSNCLNKNLSETDSLPHVRNLSEMSRSVYLNGRQSEVNDERQESCNQGMVKSVPQGQQEGEGTASGRTCCYDRI